MHLTHISNVIMSSACCVNGKQVSGSEKGPRTEIDPYLTSSDKERTYLLV